MSIGTNIQQLRKSAGLSQEQLADAIGISRQAISKWETDQSVPDVDKLVLLCDVFHVSSDELLGMHQPAASSGSVDTKLEECVKMNRQSRLFTAGWLTALVGAVLLIAEFFSLFFLRDAAIRLEAETQMGIGFYDNVMNYAAIPPMPMIFTVTAVIIAAGIVIAVIARCPGLVQKLRKNER